MCEALERGKGPHRRKEWDCVGMVTGTATEASGRGTGRRPGRCREGEPSEWGGTFVTSGGADRGPVLWTANTERMGC